MAYKIVIHDKEYDDIKKQSFSSDDETYVLLEEINFIFVSQCLASDDDLQVEQREECNYLT